MAQKIHKANIFTDQTYDAILTTTKGVLRSCKNLLSNKLDRILSGNFQSDPIQKQFGLYRSTLGSNYHVSVKSMFHAEKNLRLSSLIDRSKSLDELAHDLELFNSDYIIIRFNMEREILECA